MHAYNKDQTTGWVWASSNLNVEPHPLPAWPSHIREREWLNWNRCFNQPNAVRLREAQATYQHLYRHRYAAVCGNNQVPCLWHWKTPVFDCELKWYNVKKSTKKLWAKSSELSWCLEHITIPPFTSKWQWLPYFCYWFLSKQPLHLFLLQGIWSFD